MAHYSKTGDKAHFTPKRTVKVGESNCNGNMVGMSYKVSGGYASTTVYHKPLLPVSSMAKVLHNQLYNGHKKKRK